MAARRLLCVALALGLLGTTACSDDDDTTAPALELGAKPVESGLGTGGKPARGGQLVYALEADNINYCLPEAQVAMAGMQVMRAIYDPLVIPNAKGGYSPYLAESVEPSADFKTWTIKLREGITFHNGEKLDAKLVRDNLDAYRGASEYGDGGGANPRSPLLLSFFFQDIEDVVAADAMTVTVTTKRPWVAFPASLYASGRVAIMAREQLEADTDSCELEPIGSGPFKLTSWDVGRSLKLSRNEAYWQDAPDGEPFPYVNAIEFRPMPNDDERIASLQRGDINIMHSSTAADIGGNLAQLQHDGALNMIVSEERTETAYMLINSASEPFDSPEGRIAAAQAIDREELNRLANQGLPTVSNQPFTPDVMGWLEDNGAPKYDLDAAKAAVKKLKDAGKNTNVRLMCTTNPSSIRQWSMVKEMLESAGFTVELEVEVQTELISRVIGGDFDLVAFRSQQGDDPDANRIWWFGEGNLVNFGRFDDPVINENLDIGRTNPDPAARKKAYEEVNRQLGSQAYNVWLFFQPWAVAMAPNVHAVVGPDLPNGDEPGARLANGHSLLGLWIDNAVDEGPAA
jgi:peptide/nickel transport system substrate-binding protein